MRSCALAMIIAAVAVASTAQTAPRPSTPREFAIVTPERVRCVEQQPCLIALRASDGKLPLRWRVLRGRLPAGLTLDRDSGRITGTPPAAGQAPLTVEVTDSSSPAQTAQLRITVLILSTLDIVWQRPPALSGTDLNGTLQVTNYSGNQVVLTVVVVAVNEVGKAFTLGYQHFSIAPGATSPVIPFGMRLPPGRYNLRADAVGEVAEKNIIYRSSLQAGPFAHNVAIP